MHNPKTSFRLGVVIPLANERKTIERFLRDVLARLDKEDLVFCVLDRVSTDGTRERVQQAAQNDARIREVWAPENRCVVDAYFRGYHTALDAGCRWILEMDGGYSHNPAEIPRFIEAMEGGADFAAGSRFTPQGDYSGRWSRNFLSKGGSLLANFMLGTTMHDMTSGFECFSRKALEYVVARGVESKAHFFQTEIRYMLRNWNWVEVPISYSSPSKSVGSGAIFEALRNLWALARESRGSGQG